MLLSHEWLNTNALRSYPLTERSDKTSISGVTIPDDLFTDLTLLIPSTGVHPCKITILSFTGRLLSIVIEDATGTTMGVATMDLDEVTTGQGFPIHSAILGGTAGTIVLGDGVGSVLTAWAYGNHVFKEAYLEATTCIPIEVGPVTSLGIYGQVETLHNDVKIEAGDNIKLDYDFVDNAITITTNHEDFFKPKCEPTCDPDRCNRVPISTINDIPPTAVGCEFFIDAIPIVTVAKRDDTIVLANTLRPEDFCDAYTTGPAGKPGPPGPAGGAGPPGVLICIPLDCECEPCDGGPDSTLMKPAHTTSTFVEITTSSP